MRSRFRIALVSGMAVLVAAAVFGGLAIAAPGDHGKGRRSHIPQQGESLVLSGSLMASVPSDPAIFGVAPGGLPWSLTSGHFRLGAGGQLEVNVAGLVVTTTGMNPVPDLAASLYCNGASVGTTAPAPFSSQGNASIHATLTMPAFCPAPAVLLNPAFGTTPKDVRTGIYISFDGTSNT